MDINQLLEITIARKASDLHLSVGSYPTIRVHGDLVSIPGTERLAPSEIEGLVTSLITPLQKSAYQQNLELDFSFDFHGKARFRANLYQQKGYPAVALRLIPIEILPLESIGFPPAVGSLVNLRQGLVLVTGPTGHGKSTVLAAMINKINQVRASHVITIEDPIEYVYPPGKSLIDQRELLKDTKSWSNALRSALREDPDVVLVGEMRDLETIAATITIAETGHLVFGTLHTNSAAQSIDRIIDVFPENQQQQVRLQLSETLEAIISLRLVPTVEPGRILAYELLFATPAVRNIIREGKTYLIDNLIETSAEMGMQLLEKVLAEYVHSGKVSRDVAFSFASRPELLDKLIR